MLCAGVETIKARLEARARAGAEETSEAEVEADAEAEVEAEAWTGAEVSFQSLSESDAEGPPSAACRLFEGFGLMVVAKGNWAGGRAEAGE